jgi:hypothetical protein
MTTGEDGEVLREKIRLSIYTGLHEGERAIELTDRLLALIEPVMEENRALKHDLERQMTIANIECNEAERLREALEILADVAEQRRVKDFDPDSRVTVLETRTKDILDFHEALDNARATLSPKSEKQDG